MAEQLPFITTAQLIDAARALEALVDGEMLARAGSFTQRQAVEAKRLIRGYTQQIENELSVPALLEKLAKMRLAKDAIAQKAHELTNELDDLKGDLRELREDQNFNIKLIKMGEAKIRELQALRDQESNPNGQDQQSDDNYLLQRAGASYGELAPHLSRAGKRVPLRGPGF